jgi:hypothetical protein
MGFMITNKTGTDRPTQKSHKVPAETTALVSRYRQIGISAVAAAVRYQGVAKNPAYAPASTDKMFDWACDAA